MRARASPVSSHAFAGDHLRATLGSADGGARGAPPRPTTKAVQHTGRRATLIPLTPREREVFTLLARGFNAQEIAEQLALSPDTIRTHVRNGMVTLGARTRIQAVAMALARQEIRL